MTAIDMGFPRLLQICLLFTALLLCRPLPVSAGSGVVPPMFIAHAGGAVDGATYTNSLEALNASYEKGFRFFEVDFSWTADAELVAVHDWESAPDLLSIPGGIEVPTKSQFLQLKTKTGLTTLGLEDVLQWAGGKGDVYIVTDIRDGNVDALRKIRDKHGKFQNRVIPQVYSYREYDEVSRLGYGNIILTLYRMKIEPGEVLSFCRERLPFAVTMHWRIAQSGLADLLHDNHVVVYAHTVNDPEMFSALTTVGVFGIYTDEISPAPP